MTDKLDWNIPFAGTAGMEMHRPGGVRDAIRAARLYEQLGYVATGYSDQMQSWIFRSIWSPELIPTAAQVPDYEACYNTIPLLAAVASHTEKILLSTIVDCYRRSPSILAQELLTLDHISHGRVMIAIGTGENKQFLPYGLERTEPRNAHLEEAIRIIKTLMCTTQPVTEPDNRFWKLDEALVALPPYNPEHPPLVLLAGGGPRPMRIAGRVADGLLTYLPGGYADQVTSWEADLAEMWREAERRDRDPKSLVIAPGMTMILCENDRQISQALESPFVRSFVLNLTPVGHHWSKWGGKHPLGDDWALSLTHRSTKFSRDELLSACAMMSDEDVQHLMYVGTPEEVACRAAPWYRSAGFSVVPLIQGSFGTVLFPEQLEPGDNGLPRWHNLNVRFTGEVNRLLAT